MKKEEKQPSSKDKMKIGKKGQNEKIKQEKVRSNKQ